VGDLAPAPGGSVVDRLTAVEEIGVPDQDLASHGHKPPLDETKFLNGLLPMLLKEALGMRFNGNLLRRQPQAFRTQVWQAVATGIVDERAASGPDILEGDPYSTHESQWVAVKMDSITVIGLFAANGKVKRLKGKWFAPIQMAQEIKNDWFESKSTNAVLGLPAVL
jgi:hypothetical protein